MSGACMTVGGERATSDETFAVIDPATAEPFAVAPACQTRHLNEAMSQADDALPAWASDLDVRRAAMHRAAERVIEQADALAPLLSREQGKPLRDAVGEVQATALWLRYYAALDLPQEIVQDDEAAFVSIERKPLGVVAAITPWNFPLGLAAWKVAPALLAGNTIVLKPSQHTPLSTLALGAALADVFPPGVLNVVSGGDEVGAWMTAHATPRKVSLTGSIATGIEVATAAAADLKRMTLELGGNDPAIILGDVDVADVAPTLFAAAFANCGQLCSAVKRIYASKSVYPELVDALAAIAAETKVGPGSEPETQLGPLNNERQLERVKALVDDAVARGGRPAAGGHRLDRPGYFYSPTVVADAVDGMRLVDEEQFGPAVPVIRFEREEEAIARANDSRYGLSGSVWGADPARAAAVADRLECGTTWVNTHGARGPAQPTGGHKHSGIGVENGIWGYHEFTAMQVRHRLRGS